VYCIAIANVYGDAASPNKYRSTLTFRSCYSGVEHQKRPQTEYDGDNRRHKDNDALRRTCGTTDVCMWGELVTNMGVDDAECMDGDGRGRAA